MCIQIFLYQPTCVLSPKCEHPQMSVVCPLKEGTKFCVTADYVFLNALLFSLIAYIYLSIFLSLMHTCIYVFSSMCDTSDLL